MSTAHRSNGHSSSGRPEAGPESLPGGVRRRIALTRWSLIWERLWPAALPAALVLTAFAAVVLFDALPALSGIAHSVVLALFALAFLGAAVWGLRRVRWPSSGIATHRLEASGNVSHRPLTAWIDRPALSGTDVASRALWAAHRDRARAAMARLRTPLPRPEMARRDPYAVRGIAVLTLVVACVVGLGTADERVARAFSPTFAPDPAAIPVRVDVWISPPTYTRLAPISLADAQAPISAPASSEVLAQVHGVAGTPVIRYEGEMVAPEKIGESSYSAAFTVTEDGTLTIASGTETLASWDIVITDDAAPVVAFAETPSETERHALRVDVHATDDYGLTELVLEIVLDEENFDAPADPALRIDLPIPLPSRAPAELETTRYHDLTPHVWAGVPVLMRLRAVDALGHVGVSEVESVMLPERTFNHPVARAIIEQRKILVIAPEERELVADNLDAIADQHEDYSNDLGVYLALKTARSRLRVSADGEIESVQQILWDTALYLEDGGLALAEQELRRLQQELADALQEGASEEEIERLIEELREAMDEYMRQLAENMPLMSPEDLDQLQLQMPDNPDQTITNQDLQDLLEQLRELNEQGMTEQAQQLLSELQNMLENMQPMPFPQGPQQPSPQMEMLNDLNEVVREQRELLDETYRSAQNMPGMAPMPNPDSEGTEPRTPEELAEAQEALRRQLGEVMREFGDMMGEIPENLGLAEREMRDAEQALQGDMPGEATPSQQRALEYLQQGMNEAAQMMAEMGMLRLMPGRQPYRFGQGEQRPAQRDPLGRAAPEDRGLDTGDVEIPDQEEMKRAREILEELRRRAGEAFRPIEELEYIERLLRRF